MVTLTYYILFSIIWNKRGANNVRPGITETNQTRKVSKKVNKNRGHHAMPSLSFNV